MRVMSGSTSSGGKAPQHDPSAHDLNAAARTADGNSNTGAR
eukprot:CAMPEP_0113282180 /NCGR_PEP_ID=MMETSP0008_2-20120614/28714_1 /TAXON_ID=97485 /ORGANISM="Prymnesium parvum" /LENGTH=40 /DNA_ID=CAMNT_0000132681 /DNA_START=45 /DNA_END=165 /DNA_ORIENTATION=- /assembly_acc=CAM_ASM_000153